MPVAEDVELIRLVDENLVAFGRFMARPTPGGTAGEHDGVLLVSGANPTPVIVNSVLMTGPVVDPAAALPAAATFFEARGHGYGIWTRAHADASLEAVLPGAGFSIVVDLPVMVLNERPPTRPMAAGTEVRRVVDARGVADFRTADLAGFASDAHQQSAVDSMFAAPASLLAPGAAGAAGFVGYVDGVPAAAAFAFTARAVVRIGWVGTVPEYRRTGLGAAVTRAAVIHGFETGARLATLEASAMGEPVYRAMGFREITRYRVWVAG